MTAAATRVAIAGASGCVGRSLVGALLERGHHVLAMCRNPGAVDWPKSDRGVLATEAIDVADRQRLTHCLSEFAPDSAYYLIHSMGGGIDDRDAFVERDRMLAESFGDAASDASVGHIVYLGGHLPDSGDLSDHLASRASVARILRDRDLAVTELRAGVVIDPESAAFRMLSAIIERQSVLLIPPQFRTMSHPIAIADAVACLVAALDLKANQRDDTFDIGCEEACRYSDLIDWYAEARGVSPTYLSIPWAPREVIVPYVSALTGEDFGLVWALSGSWGEDLPLHRPHLYEIFPELPRTPARDAVVQVAAGSSGRRTQIPPSRSASDRSEGVKQRPST
jgi:uncharacterized protein YbjT (DUF2867 family)